MAPRRWQRRVIFPMAIVVLLHALITSPIAIDLAIKALLLPLPSDSGAGVDAIVVLGRGKPLREQRVDMVAQLWRAKRAPNIFTSGMMDAGAIKSELMRRGVPAQNLRGENCSGTTEENALFTASAIKPQTHRKVILVTDPPHMLRSLLVFQSMGYDPIPKISVFPEDLKSGEKLSLVGRELGGLILYAVTGRLQFRSETEIADAATRVMNRLKTQNCNL